MTPDWNNLQQKIGIWSDEKGSTLQGLIDHLIEEANDLKISPYDSFSYADILILLLSAARKVGYNMDELFQAVESKHQLNLARIFLPPNESGVTHRKKS